jgi:hypothetical protein
MQHTYHMTRVSANAKTGPIPVTTSSISTCPTSCSFRGNGCYAESGPLRLHWNKVSDGSRGGSLDDLCAEIRKIPRHQLWRWAQAGDLPGHGALIDQVALGKLVEANRGRHGFGFTHYEPGVWGNALAISHANTNGFTLNLSAETLAEADDYAALGIAPVVVVVPAGTTKPLKTPAGRHVAICPATVRYDVQCATCGICAHPTRKAIVGFPAHGAGAKKVQKVFYAKVI